MSTFDATLDAAQGLAVVQRKELAELLGYETRNKYELRTLAGEPLGFAAEQQKGVLGFLARQYLGHWRTFDILVFDTFRNFVFHARHPFRWFFQRLEIADATGRALGALQRRWSWLSKRFDVEDERGNVLLVVSSPFWRPWTFTFERNGNPVATIRKRWSGALKEMFTDADNFAVEFTPGPLSPVERRLLVAAALFVDLMFFEKKASN
jgi:uncharacterized protein YxjI